MTLKDICWLRGTNGIKKGQDGYRVSLEDDRKGARARTIVVSW